MEGGKKLVRLLCLLVEEYKILEAVCERHVSRTGHECATTGSSKPLVVLQIHNNTLML